VLERDAVAGAERLTFHLRVVDHRRRGQHVRRSALRQDALRRQKAGCWADLRPEGEDDVAVPAHVTMHGHAFFLPKTAKSKLADVEGVVSARELSQDEVDHFNGEGASLVAGTLVLGVDATGVALR
jgi:hypothetical protein